MCTNKKWIFNKYNKQSYFVNCGHCPACLQEKANKKANKIVNHYSKNYVPLFVHLTYSNDCVPYIDLDRYNNFNGIVNIYRDSYNRRIRFSSTYDFKKQRIHKTSKVGEINCENIPINFFQLKDLRGQVRPRIGILLYSDVQKYIKRLRGYVQYHSDKIPLDHSRFSYFITSEYGEKYSRPHFHLLVWVSKSYVSQWKHALASNWLFDDFDLTYRNIQVAKKPAGYIATYLNWVNDLPSFLQEKTIRPKSTHSQRFGFGNPNFSLRSILSRLECGTSLYPSEVINKDKSVTIEYLPLPSYVCNRFFPKFKGFCKLSFNELYTIFAEPINILRFRTKLGIEYDEAYKTAQFLAHKKSYFEYETFISPLMELDEPEQVCASTLDYAFYAILFHRYRERDKWRSNYSKIHTEKDLFFAYDNLENGKDLYKTSNTFDFSKAISLNPLDNPLLISKNDYLLEKFHRFKHQHTVKDTVLTRYKYG